MYMNEHQHAETLKRVVNVAQSLIQHGELLLQRLVKLLMSRCTEDESANTLIIK